MPSRPLDIAFFGSSLVSAFWNGAATYYRGMIRALHELGHRITFYEPDAYERQQHRDIPDPPYARVQVYSAKDDLGVRQALRSAGEADIVIKASGVGVFDKLLENAVLELGNDRNAIVYWDVDAPATLAAIHADASHHLGALIGDYDLVLTYGGGPAVVDAFLRLGARRCVPIYNALDTTTHFPVPPDPKFQSDLAFLGNRMPDRESRVHEFFFKPAGAMPKRKFLLGGNGWAQHAPELPNVSYLGHVYTDQHNAFNCTPLAVLNINRQSMADVGFSPATRIFEAAGAGACLITDSWRGIDAFLIPGRECLVAGSGEDVISLLEALQPEEARLIGRAAMQRVRSEHTYDLRAAQVDTIFQKILEDR
jgi:spore maturation protein CgeB